MYERMENNMSKFSQFMRANKIQKQNVMHPVSKYLLDEDGKPLMWELRPVSTKENERLQEQCMIEVPVKGKSGMYRPKLDVAAYKSKLMCAAVVYPDLHDVELQNSYGVMTPEELLKEMVDDAGEYTDLMTLVQELCGFKTLQEDVDEAKN